jgi:hypothetical protein
MRADLSNKRQPYTEKYSKVGSQSIKKNQTSPDNHKNVYSREQSQKWKINENNSGRIHSRDNSKTEGHESINQTNQRNKSRKKKTIPNFGMTTSNYIQMNNTESVNGSKVLPLNNLSYKLKNLIVSSLKITESEHIQALREANKRSKHPEQQIPVSSTIKQTYHFNQDIYEKFNLRNTIDSSQFTRSIDKRSKMLTESYQSYDPRLKENQVAQSMQQSQPIDQSSTSNGKITEEVRPVEESKRLPGIVSHSHNKSRVINALNPWQAMK